MKISPNVKKALSVLLASVAGGVSVALVKDEPQLIAQVPAAFQMIAGAIVLAIAHWLPTLGHAERVEQVATDAVAKANASTSTEQ